MNKKTVYKLGIDVGGTNTDTVLLNEKSELLASTKAPTSEDIQTGITASIESLLNKVKINPDEIVHVMLGTTQCTNAIIERKKLEKVGVIRLGYPATASIPPFTTWPHDLADNVNGSVALLEGGYEYDGRVINEINEQSIRSYAQDLKKQGIKSVAIIGVFSSVRNEQELEVERILKEIMGDSVAISLSHNIGSIGFLERENATILNAALESVIDTCISGFSNALKDHGITKARAYLCQNDGTLMSLDYARKFPIFTIASGLTNSIRGASYLEKCQDALVLDVGGTTSDIGIIASGSPRESSIAVEIGGVKTNFRMPDVISIGLGGGSIVRNVDGKITIGPDSVGHKITQLARVFGGPVLTTTDIAVRLGMAHVGDPTKVSDIDLEFAQQTINQIKTVISEKIDTMKLSAGNVTVIVVGGGSIIVPGDIDGVGKLLRPVNNAVANAIGASIAQVSGHCEKLYSLAKIERTVAINDAIELAKQQAIAAGAKEDGLAVVDIEEVELAYHPEKATRIKVKVVGDLG